MFLIVFHEIEHWSSSEFQIQIFCKIAKRFDCIGIRDRQGSLKSLKKTGIKQGFSEENREFAIGMFENCKKEIADIW